VVRRHGGAAADVLIRALAGGGARGREGEGGEAMNYEDLTDEQLRRERRVIDAQILTLDTISNRITSILNCRSTLMLQREAEKAIAEQSSYADFKAQLDSI
jgi:hypothetical protein